MNKKSIIKVVSIIGIISPFIVLQIDSLRAGSTLGSAGMAKGLWIAVFFLPLVILPMVVSVLQKIRREKIVNLFIIIASAISCMFLSMMIGYSIYFNSIDSYNSEKLLPIEENTCINFPENIEFAIDKYEDRNKCYVLIKDENEKQEFEAYIESSLDWVSEHNYAVIGALPNFERDIIDYYDLSVVVFSGTDKNNSLPTVPGIYNAYIIGYRYEQSTIEITCDFTVEIKETQ